MKGERIKQKLKKIFIILCIVLFLFNFIVPNYSNAIIGTVINVAFKGVTTIALITQLPDIITYIFDILYQVMEYILIPNANFTNLTVAFDNGKGTKTNMSFEEVINLMNRQKKGRDTDEGATEEEWNKAPYYISKNRVPTGYLTYEIGRSELDKLNLPMNLITPLDIFKADSPILDANYFDGGTSGNNILTTLHDSVRNWYNTFRIVAILGLLCVLLYLGIRMIISASVTDKAKYKNMIVDWVVALCLIFCLNYIMAFTMNIVDYLCELLAPQKEETYALIIDAQKWNVFGEDIATPTNMVGVIRMNCDINDTEDNSTLADYGLRLMNVALYGALVILMITFTIMYIKRFFTLTFLTFIAPLVALTYPIDKIRDGKAQAFGYWFREYISNAILPIVHIILYRVLILSVPNLVLEQPIYALCALAFFGPAKKMIDTMFGAKGQTVAPPSVTGAAIAGNAFNRISGEAGRVFGSFGNMNPKGISEKSGTSEPKLAKDTDIFSKGGSQALPGDKDLPKTATTKLEQTGQPKKTDTKDLYNSMRLTGDEVIDGIITNGQSGESAITALDSIIERNPEGYSARAAKAYLIGTGKGDKYLKDSEKLGDITKDSSTIDLITASQNGDEEALNTIKERATNGDVESRSYLQGRGIETQQQEGNVFSTDITEPEKMELANDGEIPLADDGEFTFADDGENSVKNGFETNDIEDDIIELPTAPAAYEKEKIGGFRRFGKFIQDDLGIPDGSGKDKAKYIAGKAAKFVAINGLGKMASIATGLTLTAGGLVIGLAKGAGSSNGVEGIINDAQTGAMSGLSTGISMGRGVEQSIKNAGNDIAKTGITPGKYLFKGGDQDYSDFKKSEEFKKNNEIRALARSRVIAEHKNADPNWTLKGKTGKSNRKIVEMETKEKLERWDFYRDKSGGTISKDKLKALDDIDRARTKQFEKEQNILAENEKDPNKKAEIKANAKNEAKNQSKKWTASVISILNNGEISSQDIMNKNKREELKQSMYEDWIKGGATGAQALRNTEMLIMDTAHIKGLNYKPKGKQ